MTFRPPKAATLDPVELPDDTTERHPVCQIAPSRMRPKVARPQAAGCGKASVFNGDSSGSARKPQETSISSREAQRAAPPADGSGTMCHR
jgi:hypothetical protein